MRDYLRCLLLLSGAVFALASCGGDDDVTCVGAEAVRPTICSPTYDGKSIPPHVDSRDIRDCLAADDSTNLPLIVVTYSLALDTHVCVYNGIPGRGELIQQIHCSDTGVYCGGRSTCIADSRAIPVVCTPIADPPDATAWVWRPMVDASADR